VLGDERELGTVSRAFEAMGKQEQTRSRPAQAPWLTSDEQDWLVKQSNRELQAKKKYRNPSISQAFRDARILRLILAYFLALTGSLGTIYWIPTFLTRLSHVFQPDGDLTAADSSSDRNRWDAHQRLALR
jgi:hypothetical protein